MKLQGVGVLAYRSERDSIMLPFQGAEAVCSCTKPTFRRGFYCISVNEPVLSQLPLRGRAGAHGEGGRARSALSLCLCPRSSTAQHHANESCLVRGAKLIPRGQGSSPAPVQGLAFARADVVLRTCSSSQPSGGVQSQDQSHKSRDSSLPRLLLHCALFQHLPDRLESASCCPRGS